MVAALTMKGAMSVLQQQQRYVSLVSTICVSDVVDLMVSKHFANNVNVNLFFSDDPSQSCDFCAVTI